MRLNPIPAALALRSSLFLVLALAAYWPSLLWMVSRWEEAESYSSHGWWIPPLCAYLLWGDRTALGALLLASHPRTGLSLYLGLLLSLFALAMHGVMGIFDIASLSSMTLPLCVAGYVLMLGGWPFLRRAWFPVAFLYFMIPLPDFMISGMNFRLKLMAADLAAWVLNGSGIAVIREGSFLVFENEKLAVGDVCSGLRSLISLVALGCLYARFMQSRGRVLCVLLVILPAAIFGNALRIFLVALLVLAFGRDFVFTPLFAGIDVHLLTGGVIFLGTFAVLYAAVSLYDSFAGKPA